MRKPFFSRTLNAFVLDEMCVCGHLKSEHGSKIVRSRGAIIRLHDDGSCCKSGCSCKQFTWLRDVTDDEMAAIIIARRPSRSLAAV